MVQPDTPAPPVAISGTGELRARLETSKGPVVIKLFENDAPRTVANFVALATGNVEWTDPAGQRTTRPLYEEVAFHRVIPGFMVQCGDPKGDGTGGPGYRFGDEIAPNLKHDQPGTLSMANAGPGTNGSQFFITEAPTPHLDGRHAVFGRVLEGQQVVHTIANVPRDGRDRPREPVTLHRVEVYRA
jgi:peptidyl-prolyl cis-trans isomerase A (cyclophilin A)